MAEREKRLRLPVRCQVPQFHGAGLKIPEAVKTCVAECKNGKRIEPLYGNYKFETDGDKAVITLEAGEIFFGKLV